MVTLRPLTRADLPLLGRWLAEPLVARWWAEDPSPAAVEARYGPSVDSTDQAVLLLAEEAGAPVGFLQHYALDGEADYRGELVAAGVDVPPGAVSLDYLLGDGAARGRGLGTELVRAGLAHAWAAHPDAHDVLVPVHAENTRSWRTLAAAGFSLVGHVELAPDNPADSSEHVLGRAVRAPDELVARYDPAGTQIGAERRSVVYADGLFHASAGVLLRSADRARVLVHRRTQRKALWPGHHDCLAGGVLAPGEDPRTAAARELAEEVGVSGVELTPLARTAFDDGRLRCHLWAFQAQLPDGVELALQAEEVAQAWWWTPAELASHLARPDWAFVPDTRALLDGVDLTAPER